MKLVLFTGYSCTGKTTICKLLEEREGFFNINVHSCISHIARGKGYERGREWFFNEGTTSVSTHLLNYLCEVIGKAQSDKIVVDDIYDFNIYKGIIQYISKKPLLIALKCSNSPRLERMYNRTSLSVDESNKELSLYDNFKIESGIDLVVSRADYMIDNELKSIGEVYYEVLNVIK